MLSVFHDIWGSNLGDPEEPEGILVILDQGNGRVNVVHLLGDLPTGENGSGEIFDDEDPPRIVIRRILRSGFTRVYRGTLNPDPPDDKEKQINGHYQDMIIDLTDEEATIRVTGTDDWTANVPPPGSDSLRPAQKEKGSASRKNTKGTGKGASKKASASKGAAKKRKK